jgi:hypothetical protein
LIKFDKESLSSSNFLSFIESSIILFT